jgi:hypothetical protein
LAIALSAAVLPGCAGGADRPPGDTPVGTVTELAFDSLFRRVDSTRLEQTEAAPIGGIINMATGPGGLLYAADFRMRDVKRYDRQGRLLGTLGQQGRGPGEFIAPVYVTTSRDGDRVAVADIAQYRVAVFDASGASLDDHQVESPVSLHSVLLLSDSTVFLGGIDRGRREDSAFGGAILAPPSRLVRQLIPIPGRLRGKAMSGSVLYGLGSLGVSSMFLALNADGVVYHVNLDGSQRGRVQLPPAIYPGAEFIERDEWIETPTALQDFMDSRAWISSLQALGDSLLVVEVTLPMGSGKLPARRLAVLEWREGRVDVLAASECSCRVLGTRGDTLAVVHGHDEPTGEVVIDWRVVGHP